MARRRSGGSRPYARTERVNELVREIVAEELMAIDDERLGLLTVTGVRVDPELRTGRVFIDGPDDLDDAVVLGALAELRPRLQSAIARQARLRRTPELSFQPDEGARSGRRIDEILGGLDDVGPAEGDPDGDGPDRPDPAAAGSGGDDDGET